MTKLDSHETKTAFAARVGLTKGRISQLVAEGLPVRADGRIDVVAEITRAGQAPWADGLWLTLMLLSTLLPTLIHVGFLLFGPLMALLAPTQKRQRLGEWLRAYDAPAKPGVPKLKEDQREAVVLETATYLARDRRLAALGAVALTLALAALLAGVVGMIHRGGLADYVASAPGSFFDRCSIPGGLAQRKFSEGPLKVSHLCRTKCVTRGPSASWAHAHAGEMAWREDTRRVSNGGLYQLCAAATVPWGSGRPCEVFATTQEQRCWLHKTMNVLNGKRWIERTWLATT